MAELVRGPNGEYGVYTPATGVEQISKEEYEQRKMSSGERFLGAVGDTLRDSAAGAIEAQYGGSPFGVPIPGVSQLGSALDAMGLNPIADAAGELMQGNDARQEARASVAPNVNFAGMAAGIGAELAIPGAPAARRVTSAARPTMSPTAQRIVKSAEDVVDANQASAAARRPNLNLVPGVAGGGPGGASGAQDLAAGSRFRRMAEETLFRDADPKVDSVRAADELGIPLTPGMRRGSQSQQVAEEGLSRNPGALEVFNREITQPTEAKISDYARQAFGIGPGEKITRKDFQQGSDAISAEFGDITEDITTKFLVAETDVAQMKDLINGATRNGTAREKLRRSYVDVYEGDRAAKVADRPFSEARLSAKDVWDTIRELNEDLGNAKGAGERDGILALRDFWEERLQGMAGEAGGTVMERIKNANEKYRVQKLLESSGVLKGEDLSFKSLANAARRQFKDQMLRDDFVDGRGRRMGPDTVNLLRSLQVVTDFPSLLGNSGTPTGAAMASGLGKAAGSIMQNRAGAEMYFGRPMRAGMAAAGGAIQHIPGFGGR